MKRSQMLEILRNSFVEHMNSYEINTDEEMYSAILADLEKNGMMPPTTTKQDPGHFPGDDFNYQINEWDEE